MLGPKDLDSQSFFIIYFGLEVCMYVRMYIGMYMCLGITMKRLD